jgi:hypothetical protein
VSEYSDVRIRWLTPAEGGRSSNIHLRAAKSRSYKPHFRFGNAGDYLGVAFLDGHPPVAAPGETTEATVALIYADTGVDYSPVATEAEFEVLEGARVVGRGIVLKRWSTTRDWRDKAAE